MAITKVFRSGNSQAVRIPKEFQIDADEVIIERQGGRLVLRPVKERNAWPEGFMASLVAEPADESFTRADQGEAREIEPLS